MDRTPKRVSKDVIRLFKNNWKAQGFVGDAGVDPWQKRKDPKIRRRILYGASGVERDGRLLTAWKVESGNGWAKIINTREYAKIHNRGLMGNAWGKYPFKMPKRQFMGGSKHVTEIVRSYVRKEFKKAFSQ